MSDVKLFRIQKSDVCELRGEPVRLEKELQTLMECHLDAFLSIRLERYQAIKMGYVVLYRSIFDLVRQLIRDETFEGEDKVLARYLKADLLIVDDMGLKALPRRSGEHLFEIIMRRYENKSTMMTSNRPLEDWGKLIGDVPAAGAILDRFLHHADVIAITGRSYRLKDQACKQSTEKV
jgi:DNA replication protein DnaC